MGTRRIAGWILVIGGTFIALWGTAAIGVATLSMLQIAFRDESMAGLGFLFGLPATGIGAMIVAVGLWLIRGATWARWTAGAIGALISAASLFLVYEALIQRELEVSAIYLPLLIAAIGLSIVAATAWPETDR